MCKIVFVNPGSYFSFKLAAMFLYKYKKSIRHPVQCIGALKNKQCPVLFSILNREVINVIKHFKCVEKLSSIIKKILVKNQITKDIEKVQYPTVTVDKLKVKKYLYRLEILIQKAFDRFLKGNKIITTKHFTIVGSSKIFLEV